MECGVVGRSGSHAQQHVAQECVNDSVTVIHLHLKMGVSIVLVMDTNMVPVRKGHVKVRIHHKPKYAVRVRKQGAKFYVFKFFTCHH